MTYDQWESMAIRTALTGAHAPIIDAIMRGSREDRLALFTLVAAILAPGESVESAARIASEFLAGEAALT